MAGLAGPAVAAEQEDGDPRWVVVNRLLRRDDSRSGGERLLGAAEGRRGGLGRGPQWALRRRVEVARRAAQRREGEEEAARAEHVLRFLVREHRLEHAVAAHGHVRSGDVRHRRERDHCDEPGDGRAGGEAPGVRDREDRNPSRAAFATSTAASSSGPTEESTKSVGRATTSTMTAAQSATHAASSTSPRRVRRGRAGPCRAPAVRGRATSARLTARRPRCPGARSPRGTGRTGRRRPVRRR